jgi:WD40 repeat protein
MISAEDLVKLNPFPGLRAFNTDEADRFFGRQQQIKELAEKLNAVSFVAVAGASGCGKSSLVRAGLLSELSRRADAETKTVWRPVVIRPGTQPIANLAEALSAVVSQDRSDTIQSGTLYGRLRLGALGLVESVRLARLDPNVRVLVVVDQFEELFRFKRMADADEASAFVKLLLNAAGDTESLVSVVITLRTDTLGCCADFRDLPEAINRGLFLVPKLTREQRKEAIIGPIQWRGCQIAPRLVQRILNDISDDFDDLPVMQHALARMWARWAEASRGGRAIDLEDYEAIGTTKEALSRHADETFTSIPELAPVVGKMFRALTERLSDGTEVRRPLSLQLLCQAIGGDPQLVCQAVERFRRPDTAFLMPGPEVPLADQGIVVDISHESLIRLWQRLHGWVQEEAGSRAMLERVVDAARRYETNQGDLWGGRDLRRALDWRQCTAPTPAWVGLTVKGDGKATWDTVARFLDESIRWRRKVLFGGLCAVALGIVAALFVAKGLRFNIEKSRALALEAFQLIDQDPARSAHLSLAALSVDSANNNGVDALRQSLVMLETAHTERILSFGAPIADVRYSSDGTILLVASGKHLTIYDSKTYESLRLPIQRTERILRAWLIDKEKILVTWTEDGQAQVQRLDDTSVRVIICEGEQNRVYTIGISPDDKHVAVGCYDGEVLVWDTSDSSSKPYSFTHKVTDPVTVTALAFSHDGRYLASGDATGTVNLWKLGYPKLWIGGQGSNGKDSPIKHQDGCSIRDIGFHPDDPELLVTAGDDNKAIVWLLDLERRRLAKDEPNKWPLEHKHPVIAAKFAPKSGDSRPLITVSGKTTQLWLNTVMNEKQRRAHDDWVNEANASADGEWLVTASSDNTARIWAARSGNAIAVLRGHRDAVSRAVFSPDGKQVVTAGEDGSVRIWNFRAPRLLASSERWALGATFDPRGERIAVGEEHRGAFILEMKDAGSGTVSDPQYLDGADSDQVSYLSWSRDGKYLIGLGSDGGIDSRVHPIVWDVARKRVITPRWLRLMLTAAFSPGSNELVTVSPRGQLSIWESKSLDVDDPQSTRTSNDEFGRWLAAISPDGRWVAALNGNIVELFQRTNLSVPVGELKGHIGQIKSLQFSADNKWLLTASADKTARIWSAESPGPSRILAGGHSAALASASFSRDGKWVVTGSADSTICVWEASTGKKFAVLRRHSEGVNSVQFSPDSQWILSASDDGTVHMEQCDTCTMSEEGLKQLSPALAKLSEEELNEIQQKAATSLFSFLRSH